MVRSFAHHRPPTHHLAIGYLFLAALFLNALLINWGTTGTVSVAAQVGSDTTPPGAPVILAPADGSTYTQTTLSASGLAEPDVLVKLYLWSGAPTLLGSVQSHTVTGSWEIPISLPEGTHTLKATATDLSDNTSDYSAPTTFTIELPKPVTLPSFALQDSYEVRVGQLLTLTAEITGGKTPYRYVITWGDGTRSTGTTSGPLSSSHRYEARGSYNILVEVRDASDAVARRTTVAYVSEDGQGPVAAPIVPVETPRGFDLLDIPQGVASLPLWSLIVTLIGLTLPALSALESGRLRHLFIPLISITQSIWFVVLFRRMSHPTRFWGVVYDSLSKEPLPRVRVKLIPGGKRLDIGRTLSTVSDRFGRFGFDVTAGTWQLEIAKAGYRFPSLLVLGTRDGWHESVAYENRVVVKRGETPYVNVPADPEGDRAKLHLSRFSRRLSRTWGVFALFVIGVSLIAEQVSLLSSPQVVELVYALLLSLLFLLNISTLVWDHHVTVPVGRLRDSDGHPVEGATVTLWRNREALEQRVTDAHGHFFFRAKKGIYSLEVEAKGLQIPTQKIQLSQNGFIAPDIQEGGLSSRELRQRLRRRRTA